MLLSFLETLINGLLSGVMYSLVAIGFVLIFKSSGVFNFAQGGMVFFAGLTFVSFLDMGVKKGISVPLMFAIAFAITLLIMILFAWGTERFVLRRMVNQKPIALFMATIGLSYFIEGLAQLMWGSQPHSLTLWAEDAPWEFLASSANILVSKADLFASGICALLVAGLAIFFNYTRIGRGLRAVADDHAAALAVGIPLQTIWVVVWGVAGFVALVAGILWGARNGVQFSLTFLALKALPVLILGGFESIAGAIVGGLLIGASEKLGEVYLGPYVGGGIESWFPYVLALLFLLVRPEGLFGEKHIDRV